MMDERPKYKMRFVGYDSYGELMGNAPAYKKHEVRELPLEYAQDWWWELVDAVPDLVIPEPRYEDSVFIEEVFVPPEDAESESGEPGEEEFIDLQPTEEVTSFSGVGMETFTAKIYPETELEGIPYEKMTVKSLKLFIEQRGGEVDSNWRKAELVKEAQRLEEASSPT